MSNRTHFSSSSRYVSLGIRESGDFHKVNFRLLEDFFSWFPRDSQLLRVVILELKIIKYVSEQFGREFFVFGFV